MGIGCRGSMNAVHPADADTRAASTRASTHEFWWHAFMNEIPLDELFAKSARFAIAASAGRRRGAAYVTVTMPIIGRA
jgi:hypothetical protein